MILTDNIKKCIYQTITTVRIAIGYNLILYVSNHILAKEMK